MLERFRREAEVIANLRHPNIVPIYDVGEGEGVAFILMPFIKGDSLRARMEREGKLPISEVRRILKEASSGLAAAHEAGVIHRDIKPENIMLEGRELRVLLRIRIANAVVGEMTLNVMKFLPSLTSTASSWHAAINESVESLLLQSSTPGPTVLLAVGATGCCGALPLRGLNRSGFQLLGPSVPSTEKVPFLPQTAAAINSPCSEEPRGGSRHAAFSLSGDQEEAPHNRPQQAASSLRDGRHRRAQHCSAHSRRWCWASDQALPRVAATSLRPFPLSAAPTQGSPLTVGVVSISKPQRRRHRQHPHQSVAMSHHVPVLHRCGTHAPVPATLPRPPRQRYPL